MKKVLSIVLSICLLVTSLSAVLTQSVSADTLDYDFENLAVWKTYAKDGSAVNAKFAQDTNVAYNGTGKSLRLARNLTHYTTELPNLKANTKYTLKMKFMVPSNTTHGSSSKRYFYAAINKPGYNYAVSKYIDDTSYVLGDNPSVNGPGDGQWHDYSIDFTTDDTTEFVFSIFITYAFVSSDDTDVKVYFDEFEFLEATKTKVTTYDGDTLIDTYEDFAGKPLTIIEPTKTGYKFMGWYTNVECTDEFNSTTFPEKDVTLYAAWEKNEDYGKQITISFDSNDGSLVESINGVSGSSIQMPSNPTKEGFVFAGWYTDDALTTAFTATTFPAEDITLYAKWIKPDTDAKFENISDWAIYHGQASGSFKSTPYIDGNNTQTKRSSAEVSINTTATGDGSKCVSLTGNITMAATKLYGLKPNTSYTITLKYFVSADTLHGTTKSWFSGYVVKKGTAMNKQNPAEYVVMKREGVTVREDGSSYALGEGWEEYSVDFTTDDTTDYFFGISNLLAVKNTDETSPNYGKGGKFEIFYDDINIA